MQQASQLRLSSETEPFSFSLCGDVVSIDVETVGRGKVESDWKQDPIFCISIASRDREWTVWLSDGFEEAKRIALGLLFLPGITRVFHNAKNDLHYFEHTFGLDLSDLDWRSINDTALLAHIHNNLDWKNLEGLVCKYLDYSPWKAPVVAMGRKLGGYQNIPRDQMDAYTRTDARATLDLYNFLVPRIPESCWKAYEIEQQLMPILYAMEREGVKLDLEYINQVKMEVVAEIASLTTQLKAVVGDINLNSGKQLAEALEGRLDFKKSKGGNPSFAKDAVAEYAAYLPEMALLSKLKKAEDLLDYLEEMEELSSYDGRLHCAYNQVGTKTFRLSCNKSNLQNIPRDDSVAWSVRKAFIPTHGTLFSYDFSQIEMVLFAHYTRDQLLIDALTNGDVHRQTAALVTGKEPADVTSLERFLYGKKINFAVLYGAGGKRLATEITMASGTPTNERTGKMLLNRFYEGYPRARPLVKGVVAAAEQRGWIKTLLGRRLHVDPQASYKAVNYLIQGGGAELVKLAMIGIEQEFPGIQAITVHDEIILDADLSEQEQVRVKDIMEHCLTLVLPIKAEMGASTVSWGHISK